jgi:hypothetical protein
MERIDPVGPWEQAIPRVDRLPATQRSNDQRKREQQRRDPSARKRPAVADDADQPDEDGESHVDVTV